MNNCQPTPRTWARIACDHEKRPGRAHALRCKLELRDDGWHAQPFERQGSHVLTSMLGADCLALIPTESGSIRAGLKRLLEKDEDLPAVVITVCDQPFVSAKTTTSPRRGERNT